MEVFSAPGTLLLPAAELEEIWASITMAGLPYEGNWNS
jgi:hypothetical protein